METTPADRGPDAVPPFSAPVEQPLGDGRHLAQILSSQRLESLGRLATGVAHDFNNVLGVILGYVELARMTDVPERVDRHLTQALSTIGRARTLADRLMEFARGGVLDKGQGDLNQAVEQVCQLLAETSDRRITFANHLANDTPWISLPPEWAQQVVMNLCANAIDAMGDEPGTLTVETKRLEIDSRDAGDLSAGTYARLRVRDTGPGIPRAGRSWIFEPYATTRADGTGMGLWAVRRIVEDAGGSVHVAEAGEGALFTVILPAREMRTEGPQRPVAGVGAATGQILIVDDEPAVREVVRAFLESAGHGVEEAATGEAALQRLQTGGIDLVLLDLHLTDTSGRELARQIGELVPAPKIVVITGDPGAEDLGGLVQLGKPFLRGRLLDTVQDVLTPPGD